MGRMSRSKARGNNLKGVMKKPRKNPKITEYHHISPAI